MLKSMTGFGSADGPVAGGRLQIEIRTVNHRHFNAQLKVPGQLQEFEPQMRETLRRALRRGHVAVAARWTETAEPESRVSVNTERAREIVTALTALQETIKLPGHIDITFVARQPEVLEFGGAGDTVVPWEDVAAVLEAAVGQVLAARTQEGAALAEALGGQLDAIESQLAEVERDAPDRLTAERDRLQRSVGELLDGRALDDGRLEQEIALLADRLDITEEIVRLRAHLDAARSSWSSAEPVGKRLAFLMQEMLREVNTIGSKANHAGIAHAVIAMKGELERFREQIENIE